MSKVVAWAPDMVTLKQLLPIPNLHLPDGSVLLGPTTRLNDDPKGPDEPETHKDVNDFMEWIRENKTAVFTLVVLWLGYEILRNRL